MTRFTTPVLRFLDGLAAGSGRTLVVAGPSGSGKSELLEEIRQELSHRGGRVHNLRGEHRFRDLPFSALESLDRPAQEVGGGPDGGPSPPEVVSAGIAFVPVDAEQPVSSRRRGDRGRGGGPVVHLSPTRPRGPPRVDADQFWHGMVDEAAAERGRSVSVFVDEGVFVDPESREVLLYLSERARLRPVGLVLSLDSSVAAYAAWEERLLGHGDVDFVRLSKPRADPRDVRRAREGFEALPERCRRVLGLTALLGGPVSEVTLSRVTRLTFPQLADALLPATEAGFVKVENGRIIFPHRVFADEIPEVLSAATKADMHREIAEALAALNPEPSLERRLELSHHYFEWYPGPNALRYLLETAELTERLHAYDSACEALAKAMECIPSLPAMERTEAEAEIRLLLARCLSFAGRLSDAEESLREGVTSALEGKVAMERLEEWVEALIPALEVVGPRPTLATELVELAERAHASGAAAVEVILQSVLARYDLDRGRHTKARDEANRAARLARALAPGPAQALALFSVGLARSDGTPEEQKLARRFLMTADAMMGRSRRFGLQLEVQEAELRLREAEGERETARRAREHAIPATQRLRQLTVELAHQLAIAGHLLDESTDARAHAALQRAHEITEILHLVPPAPDLLRLWILEGRYHGGTNAPALARDRFEAVAAQPPGLVAARTRAEARLRLAMLEAGTGRDSEAKVQLERLARPDLLEALRPEWKEWLDQIARRYQGPEGQPAMEGNTPGSTA